MLARRHAFPAEPGLHELDSDLEHLGFAFAHVEGSPVELRTGLSEMLIVVIEAPSGTTVGVEAHEFVLPPRTSVFDDEPAAVYAPPGSHVRLAGGLKAAIFRARAEGDSAIAGLEPYAILPDEVSTVQRGHGNFQRCIRNILPAERRAARLLVGETLNPPGNWSSSPPHRHDRNVPGEEAELEEIYLYRLAPRQGFGIQLSYATDPAHEVAFAVRDLDVVSIPAGYHPVVAGPGYGLYYLWCLAGHGRELLWRPDPAHAWVDGG